MILFDVTIDALDGRRDGLRALLRRTMAASRAEPGCLLYRFSVDLDQADRFHLVELWEGEEALHKHASAESFRTFLSDLPSLGRISSSIARSGALTPYVFQRPSA